MPICTYIIQQGSFKLVKTYYEIDAIKSVRTKRLRRELFPQDP